MSTVEAKCKNTEGEWEPRTLEAIETGTPGLVVSPVVFHTPGYEGWWAVTHVATGLRLPPHFPESEKAVSFANDLGKMANWTAEKPEQIEGFADAYREAKARHGGLCSCKIEPNEEV